MQNTWTYGEFVHVCAGVTTISVDHNLIYTLECARQLA